MDRFELYNYYHDYLMDNVYPYSSNGYLTKKVTVGAVVADAAEKRKEGVVEN